MNEEPRYPEFAEFFRNLTKNYSSQQGQEFLAKTLMSSQSTISKIQKGFMLPSDTIITQIINQWGVDITDEVEKARKGYEDTKRNIRKDKSVPAVKTDIRTKPRLPVTASAGRLSAYVDGIRRYECEDMPVIRSLPDYDFTMYIKGNSMTPKYESGDEIALKKATIIEWGNDYVLDTEDGPVFKKIYEDGENIRCVSYNYNEYPDFLVPKSSIYGFYRFVGLIRV